MLRLAHAGCSTIADAVSHDQNFKNLIVDYPRDALAFFAPADAPGRAHRAGAETAGSGDRVGVRWKTTMIGAIAGFRHRKEFRTHAKRSKSPEMAAECGGVTAVVLRGLPRHSLATGRC